MRNLIINIDYLVLIFIWFMIEYGSVRLIITPCQNSNERLKTKSVGAAIIVRVRPAASKVRYCPSSACPPTRKGVCFKDLRVPP